MSPKLEQFVATLERNFKRMTGEALTIGPIESCSVSDIEADVSAHLSVVGNRSAWVIITLSGPAAVDLVKRVAGIDVEYEAPIVADAVGELLNVVVGTAQKGSGFRFSLPVIARGRGHHVKVHTQKACECVFAKSAAGTIGLYLVEGEVESDGDRVTS